MADSPAFEQALAEGNLDFARNLYYTIKSQRDRAEALVRALELALRVRDKTTEQGAVERALLPMGKALVFGKTDSPPPPRAKSREAPPARNVVRVAPSDGGSGRKRNPQPQPVDPIEVDLSELL